jgi:hypothetical protein
MHTYLTHEEMEALETALSSPDTNVLDKPLPEFKRNCASSWLFWFFNWGSSPQGHNYWSSVHKRLEREKV